MSKDDKKNNKKSASFSSLTTDDKLERLYNTLCTESGNTKKRFEGLNLTLNAVAARVKETNSEVIELNGKLKDVNEEMSKLKVTVAELQQATYRNDVVIRGVPEVEGSASDLLSIVQLILEKINTTAIIQLVKRIGPKNETNRLPRTILLQVHNSDERKSIMNNKRKTKVTCDQLVFKNQQFGTGKDTIYMDERLAKSMADLCYSTRMLRKTKRIFSTWIRNRYMQSRKTHFSVIFCVVPYKKRRKCVLASKKTTEKCVFRLCV